MRIILLGPPGVGKGTQARYVQQKLCVPHVDSGEIFREMAAKGTALGIKAKSYTDRGELVPDSIVTEIVFERLRTKDCAAGFILVGFPRTVPQCKALDGFLGESGVAVNLVIQLTAPEEVIVERLSGRCVCRQCSKNFHVVFHPPVGGTYCDRCGGTLFQRDDDMPETIKQRLAIFKQQTMPVVQYYSDRKLLVPISACGSPDEVFARILEVLNRVCSD